MASRNSRCVDQLARSGISPAMVKVMSLESNRLASSELALGKVEHAEGVHVQLDGRRRGWGTAPSASRAG